MTEAEWLRSTSLPAARRLTRRVGSLFAVACVDRTPRTRVEPFLRMVTNLVGEAVESCNWSEVDALAPQASSNCVGVELDSATHSWKIAALRLTTQGAYQTPMHLLKALEGTNSVVHLRRMYLKSLADITGNPLLGKTDRLRKPYPIPDFEGLLRTSTALSLAQLMYESRDFSTMPILADALQDAGCDSVEKLQHCRDESLTHVRGCWAVDSVLGKL